MKKRRFFFSLKENVNINNTMCRARKKHCNAFYTTHCLSKGLNVKRMCECVFFFVKFSALVRPSEFACFA